MNFCPVLWGILDVVAGLGDEATPWWLTLLLGGFLSVFVPSELFATEVTWV